MPDWSILKAYWILYFLKCLFFEGHIETLKYFHITVFLIPVSNLNFKYNLTEISLLYSSSNSGTYKTYTFHEFFS